MVLAQQEANRLFLKSDTNIKGHTFSPTQVRWTVVYPQMAAEKKVR